MASQALITCLRSIRTLAVADGARELDDGQLLEVFARRQTDAPGRITWRNLVPGVTYRVGNREFTVRPGEELDLGDLK